MLTKYDYITNLTNFNKKLFKICIVSLNILSIIITYAISISKRGNMFNFVNNFNFDHAVKKMHMLQFANAVTTQSKQSFIIPIDLT